jgi:hypothetical protein
MTHEVVELRRRSSYKLQIMPLNAMTAPARIRKMTGIDGVVIPGHSTTVARTDWRFRAGFNNRADAPTLHVLSAET